MDVSFRVVEVCFLIGIGALGTISNAASILAFTLFKPTDSALGTTTVSLLIQLCLYDLFLSCVALPMRIWNIVANLTAAQLGDSNIFYDNSAACWIAASSLTTSYTIAWTLLCLAVTRLVAAFKPHQYEKWLDKRWLRWTLNLNLRKKLLQPLLVFNYSQSFFSLWKSMAVEVDHYSYGTCVQIPVVCGYGFYILFAVAKFIKASASARSKGICVFVPTDNTTAAIGRFSFVSKFNIFFRLLFPLAVGAFIYVTIFIKLWRRHRRHKTITPQAIITAGNSFAPGVSVAGISTIPTLNAPPPPAQRAGARVQQQRQMLRSAKMLALSYVLYTCCLVPFSLAIAFWLGVPTPNSAVVGAILETIQFFAACISPLVYFVTMRDMRVALRKLLASTKCIKH